MASSTHNASIGGSGKLLNSIEGLQHHLDDFSIDDLGAAAEKIKTLALRLSELQHTLANLAQIKGSMSAVRRAIDEAGDETTKRTELEAFDAPLPLQAIVQASKLIRFPRLAKAARELSRTAPRDSLPAEPVGESAGSEASSAPQGNAFSPEHEIFAKLQVDDSLVAASSAGDEVERLTDIAPDTLGAGSVAEGVVPADTSADNRAASTTESDDAPQPLSAVFEMKPTGEETTIGAESGFDQRLLDDLIRNYGEFAASAHLAVPHKASAETAPKVKTSYKRPSELKVAHETPVKENLPSVKKDGELDRQLKKLIKDYGEYDLYRRQRPINLKTGAIAAFLLLAIILSGFYFFSARQPAHPAQSSPTTMSGPKAPDGTPATGMANDTDKALPSGGSGVHRPSNGG